MAQLTKQQRLTVIISSVAAGVAIGVMGVFTYFTNLILADYIFLIAIVVGMTPYAVMKTIENRWLSSIEKRIPELLEDIAEGQLAGMTFVKALEASAMKDYGPITEEVKRIISRTKLGGTIEEGFEELARRVNSKLVRRVSGIMVETTRAGGDISKIIRSLAAYLRQIQTMNIERKATMKVYIGIVYIAFGVFITTVVILVNQFFYPMIGLGSTIFAPQADFITYRRIFFYMSMLQGLFSGIVAGKMGEGTIVAGFKHAIIMMIITLIVYLFIVIPP